MAHHGSAAKGRGGGLAAGRSRWEPCTARTRFKTGGLTKFSRRSALAVLAVLLFSPPGSAQEYERILLPVVVATTPGAYGSIWSTSLIAHNGADTAAQFEYPFGCRLGACLFPTDVAPHETSDLPLLWRPPAATPGLLVYVSQPQSPSFTFNLRTQDLSRQALTWGTEIPAVRESEARSGVTHLLNIPTDDRFRILLRVYDFDSRPQSIVHVRVLPVTSNVAIAELDLALAIPSEQNFDRPYYPGYASLQSIVEIPGVAAQQQVRIEITPVTEGLRYWAFVSVTNNETQHVTTISPQ